MRQAGLAGAGGVVQHIYPAPGMDEELLARKVIRRLREAGITA
jgi:hypothetical protein